MSKGFLVGIVLILLSACTTQRKVCPAYQSAFIFDQEALRKKFSYFENDSTPKVYTASRTAYLLIPEESYRKKLRSLQTIDMVPVYTIIKDSTKGKQDGKAYKVPENIDSLLRTQTMDLAPPPEAKPKADSIVKKDSVEVDSSYQISKDKEVRYYRYIRDSLKYRVDNIRYKSEQEMYLWYLRDVLVLPDVRAAMENEKKSNEEEDKPESSEPDSVKKGGFFKGLFKKGPKSDSSIVSEDIPEETEEDVLPDSSVIKRKQRKLKKAEKKKETKKPAVEKKKDPIKKEEDDGF